MSTPNQIYVKFAESGSHNIQQWSRKPFDGATAYVNAGNGAPLQPGDTDGYTLDDLPFALREVAGNIYVECEQHVLEDSVRILNQSAETIAELRARVEVLTEAVHRARRHADNIGITDGSYIAQLDAALATDAEQ